MEQLFYAMAVLACPVGMGLMMFFMMRRPSDHHTPPESNSELELARLRAELDQLKAAHRDRSATGSDRP